MKTAEAEGGHTWRFFRAGGFDQLRLETREDLVSLETLDQKLWVALSCPTRDLECDSRTLRILDTDRDGRIRPPEILGATKWVCACLKDLQPLMNGASTLPLEAIDATGPEGRQILSSARQILANLGKSEAREIGLEDLSDTTRIFGETLFNGDGVIPPEAAEDPDTREVIRQIMACAGSEMDRSGRPGITADLTERFFTDLRRYADWKGEAAAADAILPLGEGTPAAAEALRAVRAKVDDYFTRCRLAAFDGRSLTALNREEKDYLAFAGRSLTITDPDIAGLPLARIEAERSLPLVQGVNPAWSEALRRFGECTVRPFLGEKASLTETEWRDLCARLDPYEAWLSRKAGTPVEALPMDRVTHLLDPAYEQGIRDLIARDTALEPEAKAIEAVERLLFLTRDLLRILNNFVSFRDFYSRREKAVFQAGTLYLDTRSCDLCVRVQDMARHAALAPLSRIYIAYCACVREETGEKMTIAAAVTDGDAENLMVGRNGVFYDRMGRDWDATIVKIVENPISIRQAFWAPYKRIVRFIEEQVAKRATAADTAASEKVKGLIATGGTAAEAGKVEARPKLDTGLIAALGVGAAGIGGMLGTVVSSFLALGPLMPLGVLSVILLISGPSMVLAWIKLRERNLGPLLDANGWAVNARARINIPFGASLTGLARLPSGSRRDLADPYAEKGRPWLWWVILLLLLGAGLLCYGIAR